MTPPPHLPTELTEKINKKKIIKFSMWKGKEIDKMAEKEIENCLRAKQSDIAFVKRGNTAQLKCGSVQKQLGNTLPKP